jgi:hypothetical protein
MGMLDPEIVQIEAVLFPEVMMPDGRTLDEQVRDAQCVLPAVETKETYPVVQRPSHRI